MPRPAAVDPGTPGSTAIGFGRLALVWTRLDVTPTFLAGCATLAAAAHWSFASGESGFALPNPMVALAGLASGVALSRIPAALPRRGDWLLFILAMLACMLPYRTGAAPALAAAALMARRGGGIAGRAAGTMLLALAGWALKDGVWAGLASSPVLWLETHIVAQIMSLLGFAAEAEGNFLELPNGHGFVVLRACSILSLAYPCALATYALSYLLRATRLPGAWRILAVLGLLLVANTARLVAMAVSPAVYTLLHDPSASAPLQLVWGGIILAGALPSRRRLSCAPS